MTKKKSLLTFSSLFILSISTLMFYQNCGKGLNSISSGVIQFSVDGDLKIKQINLEQLNAISESDPRNLYRAKLSIVNPVDNMSFSWVVTCKDQDSNHLESVLDYIDFSCNNTGEVLITADVIAQTDKGSETDSAQISSYVKGNDLISDPDSPYYLANDQMNPLINQRLNITIVGEAPSFYSWKAICINANGQQTNLDLSAHDNVDNVSLSCESRGRLEVCLQTPEESCGGYLSVRITEPSISISGHENVLVGEKNPISISITPANINAELSWKIKCPNESNFTELEMPTDEFICSSKGQGIIDISLTEPNSRVEIIHLSEGFTVTNSDEDMKLPQLSVTTASTYVDEPLKVDFKISSSSPKGYQYRFQVMCPGAQNYGSWLTKEFQPNSKLSVQNIECIDSPAGTFKLKAYVMEKNKPENKGATLEFSKELILKSKEPEVKAPTLQLAAASSAYIGNRINFTSVLTNPSNLLVKAFKLEYTCPGEDKASKAAATPPIGSNTLGTTHVCNKAGTASFQLKGSYEQMENGKIITKSLVSNSVNVSIKANPATNLTYSLNVIPTKVYLGPTIINYSWVNNSSLLPIELKLEKKCPEDANQWSQASLISGNSASKQSPQVSVVCRTPGTTYFRISANVNAKGYVVVEEKEAVYLPSVDFKLTAQAIEESLGQTNIKLVPLNDLAKMPYKLSISYLCPEKVSSNSWTFIMKDSQRSGSTPVSSQLTCLTGGTGKVKAKVQYTKNQNEIGTIERTVNFQVDLLTKVSLSANQRAGYTMLGQSPRLSYSVSGLPSEYTAKVMAETECKGSWKASSAKATTNVSNEEILAPACDSVGNINTKVKLTITGPDNSNKTISTEKMIVQVVDLPKLALSGPSHIELNKNASFSYSLSFNTKSLPIELKASYLCPGGKNVNETVASGKTNQSFNGNFNISCGAPGSVNLKLSGNVLSFGEKVALKVHTIPVVVKDIQPEMKILTTAFSGGKLQFGDQFDLKIEVLNKSSKTLKLDLSTVCNGNNNPVSTIAQIDPNMSNKKTITKQISCSSGNSRKVVTNLRLHGSGVDLKASREFVTGKLPKLTGIVIPEPKKIFKSQRIDLSAKVESYHKGFSTKLFYSLECDGSTVVNKAPLREIFPSKKQTDLRSFEVGCEKARKTLKVRVDAEHYVSSPNGKIILVDESPSKTASIEIVDGPSISVSDNSTNALVYAKAFIATANFKNDGGIALTPSFIGECQYSDGSTEDKSKTFSVNSAKSFEHRIEINCSKNQKATINGNFRATYKLHNSGNKVSHAPVSVTTSPASTASAAKIPDRINSPKNPGRVKVEISNPGKWRMKIRIRRKCPNVNTWTTSESFTSAASVNTTYHLECPRSGTGELEVRVSIPAADKIDEAIVVFGPESFPFFFENEGRGGSRDID